MSDNILDLISGQGTDSIHIEGAPFVRIIQKGSPQIDDTHEKYREKGIADAKVGDILLSNKNQVICKKGESVTFVPLAITSLYAEFNDGKFVKNHPPGIITHKDYAKGRNPEKPYKEYLGKNDLDYTIFVAGLVFLKDGSEIKVILQFTSTALKDARALQKALATFKDPQYTRDGKPVVPPIFARSWSLATEPRKNDAGGWFGWKIEPSRVFSLTDTNDVAELRRYSALCTEAVKALPSSADKLQLVDNSGNSDEDEAF